MRTLVPRLAVAIGVLVAFAQGCRKRVTDVVSPSAPSALTPSTRVVPTPTDGHRVVTVGFWQNDTCTGDMIGTISFPVDFGDTQCFSWPGRSGTNSASRFHCGDESFDYTQWTTLTCSGGQVPEGTRKTVTISGCTQGVPPQQYARILDFTGCSTQVEK